MPKYLYVACDGGLQNTLSGAGGILEVRLDRGLAMRYHEFPDGMGASPHFLKQSPDKRFLVVACGNSGQIYVFTVRESADGRAYDIENPYRILNGFNSLGIPERGPDGTTDFFDFWGEGPAPEDSEYIVTHYNRRLIKVHLETGRITVLNDLTEFIQTNPPPVTDLVGPKRPPRFLHQVTVSGDFIIVDDALGECIIVLKKISGERAEVLYYSGDGYTGGHHCHYREGGNLRIVRPSFNFESFGSAFQVMDNTLSVYSVSEEPAGRAVKTFSYAYHMPNHAPVDLFVEDGFLYGAFGIPGAVIKFDLRTGGMVAVHRGKRPWLLRRLRFLMTDYFSWHLTHGTFLKQFDQTSLGLKHHVHAFGIGLAGGTRGGFFTLAPDPDGDVLYACHRGLNRLYCLDKRTLRKRWSRKLPKQKRDYGYFHSPLYFLSGYLAKGLGVHHGKVVKL